MDGCICVSQAVLSPRVTGVETWLPFHETHRPASSKHKLKLSLPLRGFLKRLLQTAPGSTRVTSRRSETGPDSCSAGKSLQAG